MGDTHHQLRPFLLKLVGLKPALDGIREALDAARTPWSLAKDGETFPTRQEWRELSPPPLT